jgi:hypothetical protein
VPRTLSIDVGALAARTRLEANGSTSLNPYSPNDLVSQIYSVYAAPQLTTHVGDVGVNASYMAGYSKLTRRTAIALPPTARGSMCSTIRSCNRRKCPPEPRRG